MILAAIGTITFVSMASVEPPRAAISPAMPMSTQQRAAHLRPLVRSATECIARTVSADARYPASQAPAEVNEIIVDAMKPCSETMRDMIEAHDRLYGDGTGETFFMGPYLDFLPVAVKGILSDKAR